MKSTRVLETNVSLESPKSSPSDRRRAALIPLAIFALAIVMAAPTIHGRFVGGDDHRLVLNHVLVSRPSLAHALKLFTIFHRDLYQPLPLLTFSIEFAVADALGLRADQVGPGGGAWIFHLTNILLHATNAVLVWFLLVRIQPGRAVATIAGALFAIHPLQVEVVAWTNGRMMLMSTLFALWALISLARYLSCPRAGPAVLTVLLVVLSMMSKVRIGLPVLMLVVALACRIRLDRRFLWVWVPSAALTVAFAILNIEATSASDMFFRGVDYLQGSRVARSIIAVAWYFTHLIRPGGLSAWYEPPKLVTWGEARTLQALVVVIAVLAAVVLTVRRTRVGWLGLVWFLATIGATLPLVPARNLLAADRYIYLPIVGLLWVFAALILEAFRWASHRWSDKTAGVWGGALALACAAALLTVAWRTARYYESPIAKMERILEVHPNSPRVRVLLGWGYFRAGNYDRAMMHANEELKRHFGDTVTEAWQLIAACHLQRQEFDRAIDASRQAVAVAPEDKQARYRLAATLADAGHDVEALAAFRRIMPQLPRFNPGMMRAAAFYRAMGYDDDAWRLYERVLVNNPYDIFAPVCLAEMDIESGRYEAAAGRLESLLAWMPDHTAAGVNLGVCYTRLGRVKDAVAIYKDVIGRDPLAVQAMLNLALLHQSAGDANAATALFNRAADVSDGALEILVAFHEHWMKQGRSGDAVAMWRYWLGRDPADTEGRLWLGWALAMHGAVSEAQTTLQTISQDDLDTPLGLAASAVLSLSGPGGELAVAQVRQLCDGQSQAHRNVREHLLNATLWIGERNHESPWPYYVAAVLFEADGQRDKAKAGLQAFIELCDQLEWRRRASEHLEKMEHTGE